MQHATNVDLEAQHDDYPFSKSGKYPKKGGFSPAWLFPCENKPPKGALFSQFQWCFCQMEEVVQQSLPSRVVTRASND
jgi:hypothetical protein